MSGQTISERLDNRLSTVAAMLPACDTFYDIGTDHGKLPAHLLAVGKCKRAVLSDVREKPLAKAQKLFRSRNLEGTFVLTDGLHGLSPTANDAVAICGMGAHVMLGILKVPLPCPAVLQPSARVELLRAGLRHLTVHEERLAREGGRFYVCLSVKPGEPREISARAAYIGQLRGDPLYSDYLLWRRGVLEKALSGGSADAALNDRMRWIEEELCALPSRTLLPCSRKSPRPR